MKKYFTGFLTALLLVNTGLVFANEISTTINAIFGKIILSINGKVIDEETVLINGVTYVPIRAVGNALDLNVTWDEQKNIAGLNSKSHVKQPDTSIEKIPTTNGNGVKYYREYKTVVDFGSVINVKYDFKTNDNSTVSYFYKPEDIGTTTIADYKTLLHNDGFADAIDFIDKADYAVMKDSLLVAVTNDPDFIQVFIFDTSN